MTQTVGYGSKRLLRYARKDVVFHTMHMLRALAMEEAVPLQCPP
jgi:hypothetical protein